MTAFRTCKNCVGDGACDLQTALRGALKGLRVTSVKHRCASRAPLFSVGQRVSVTWPVILDDERTDETWPATVIKESGSRFLIKVDDVLSDYETLASEYVKNPSLFARVTSARLGPLDEPASSICQTCDRVGPGAFGEAGCVGYTAANSGGFSYRPQRCAALLEGGRS